MPPATRKAVLQGKTCMKLKGPDARANAKPARIPSKVVATVQRNMETRVPLPSSPAGGCAMPPRRPPSAASTTVSSTVARALPSTSVMASGIPGRKAGGSMGDRNKIAIPIREPLTTPPIISSVAGEDFFPLPARMAAPIFGPEREPETPELPERLGPL